MRIAEGKQADWDAARAANTDPYGGAVIAYAEQWADAMEAAMDKGIPLEKCWKDLSFEVNRRPGFDISGAMFGFAVSTLAQAWEHGEELRRLHNIDLDPAHGAEVKGTLNPAFLTIE